METSILIYRAIMCDTGKSRPVLAGKLERQHWHLLSRGRHGGFDLKPGAPGAGHFGHAGAQQRCFAQTYDEIRKHVENRC